MSYLNLKPVEFDAMGKRNQDAFKWEGRILLPKYDGCFAMVAFYKGNPDYILSRTGEVVKSMDHIFDDLLKRYPWLGDSKSMGRMVLGEAWVPGKEFSEISGVFRRQRPQPELGFAPFDLVAYRHDGGSDLPTLWSTAAYQDRLATLQDARHIPCQVYPPLPVQCEDKDHAWRYARNLKELGGYDGAICSDPYATYTPGAGKGGEFIKLKPLLTWSLEVVAVDLTVGGKTGRAVGTPVVRFKNGTCGVGTGYTNEAAQGWYDRPDSIIGKIIEVAGMGVSSKGLIREPRFVGIRDDVIKADY